MRAATALGALGLAACTTPAPRALVQINPSMATRPSGAVLIIPTRCTTEPNDAWLCNPQVYESNGLRALPTAFAPLIDPTLQLKLELAGYVLAEATTMRMTPNERTDVHSSAAHDNSQPTTTSTSEVNPGTPLLDLPEPDLVAVARSLGLAAIARSTLRISSRHHGVRRYHLTVVMESLEGRGPMWTVTCEQEFEGTIETPRILASCVGNGVLAAVAPDALIGHTL